MDVHWRGWVLAPAIVACSGSVSSGPFDDNSDEGETSAEETPAGDPAPPLSIEESCTALCTAPNATDCEDNWPSTTACVDACIREGDGCTGEWAAAASCVVGHHDPENSICAFMIPDACDGLYHAYLLCN